MYLKNILLVGGACLGLFFRHHIKDIFYECIVDNFTSLFCSEMTISNNRNPRSAYAVKNELTRKLGEQYCTIVNDGITSPEFTLPYGRYFIQESFGYIYIIYHENTTTMRLITTPWSDNRNFKNYVERVYKDYCSSCKMIVFYTSNNDKWAFPIIREPRNFNDFSMTGEMKELLADVEVFKQAQDRYIKTGIPFRRGYLLFGVPGTGKSTCIEMAARKYNMGIYLLNLNTKEMSDAILINLISRVPPNSIICIEEVDKQMETLKKNSHGVHISIGGILTALDGPQRLSHGSIVMLTANKKNFLSPDDEAALLRTGRIDQVYEFTTRLQS